MIHTLHSLNNKHITVSEGQESWSSLAGWFWLRVSQYTAAVVQLYSHLRGLKELTLEASGKRLQFLPIGAPS